MPQTSLASALRQIAEARHHDPFSVLGRHHAEGNDAVVRVFLPGAAEVRIAEGDRVMARKPGSDHFEWRGDGRDLPPHYGLIWRDGPGREHFARDPYTFMPQIGDLDLHLFAEGKHGFGIRGAKGLPAAEWPQLAMNWIASLP